MINMGEYHSGPIKASQVIAITSTSEHPVGKLPLIQFLFGDEEGAVILETAAASVQQKCG